MRTDHHQPGRWYLAAGAAWRRDVDRDYDRLPGLRPRPAVVGGVAGLVDLRVALGVIACPAGLLALIAALGPLPQRVIGAADAVGLAEVDAAADQ
jgi:hypothetical protein